MAAYKYISTFKKYNKKSVGNKFMQLSELDQITNVPNAVCITSQAFKESINVDSWKEIQNRLMLLQSNGGYRLSKIQKEIALELTKIKFSESLREELEQVYKKISKKGKLKLITRSSSNFEDGNKSSGAGIYESYAEIDSFDELLKGVRVCWESSFSLSAISHRLRVNKFDLNPLPGVIIQQFVKAELSGVVFSNNPLGGVKGKFIEYTTDGSDGIESGTGVSTLS